VLLLYTDGLIERRDLPIDVGLANLVRAVADAGDVGVEALAERVLSAVAPDHGHADDTAVLVVAVERDAVPDDRQVRRRLPSDRSSPAIARRFVADVLQAWDLGDRTDLVQLLVSELVTNAVLHTATDVELRLTQSGSRLRAEVADGSGERMVSVHAPDGEATSGRGLQLVESLADAWDVDLSGTGKTVWFELVA
jgi:anti-sigma regulatory factor (Ser/Thr protein kinase)